MIGKMKKNKYVIASDPSKFCRRQNFGGEESLKNVKTKNEKLKTTIKN